MGSAAGVGGAGATRGGKPGVGAEGGAKGGAEGGGGASSASAVAGVDGGGSGTRALILDGEGRALGSGKGPPGLVLPDHPSEAADAVESAVREAAAAAGSGLPLAALWCGLAGAGRGDGDVVERILAERGLARWLRVGTDVEAALRDAFDPGAPGIVLVSGTGSIAIGSGGGARIRAGGWGAVLGDEGSGHAIGLAGIRAVLRAHDGRAPFTALREPVLELTGAEGPEDLVAFVRAAPGSRVAALAPEVIRLGADVVEDTGGRDTGDGEGPDSEGAGGGDTGDAARGNVVDSAGVGARDPAAEEIVRRAVEELALLVRAVDARMGSRDSRTRPPVALVGGLLAPGRPLRPAVAAAVRDQGHPILDRPVRAERGAALLALERCR